MHKPAPAISLALLGLLLLSACGAGNSTGRIEGTAASETSIAEIVAATMQAGQAIQEAVAGTMTALAPGVSPDFTPTQEVFSIPTETLAASGPVVTVSVQTNCRVGPGTGFDVLGILEVGETAEVVGRSIYNDNWVIKLAANPDVTCWLWGEYATVRGDIQSVPVITPPATPTSQPVSPPDSHGSQVNLVPGLFELDTAALVCGHTFTVGIDVINQGDKPTISSGTVALEDVRVADGTVQANTIGGFPILAAGQSYRVNMPLTISTWYNQTHRLKVTIDPSNAIPESDEGDNFRTFDYTLQQGSCP